MRALLQSIMILLILLGGASLASAQDPSEEAAPEVLPPPDSAGPLEVRGSVDRALLAPGDSLTWTITVRHPASAEVELPEFGRAVQGLVVADYERPDATTVAEVVEQRRTYQLRGDVAGTYVIPPVSIPWSTPDGAGGVAWTGQVLVTVSADATSDADLLQEGLRDLHPPIAPQADLRPYYLGGLALLALLVLIFFARWWIGRGVVVQEEPPRPAAEVALEALLALDASGALDGDPRGFCFELSRLMRAYLEGRFSFPALEWTSSEIERGLPDDPVLGPGLRASVAKVLHDTDLVKFAGQTQPRATLLDLRERVERLVKETPLPAPSDEQEEAA